VSSNLDRALYLVERTIRDGLAHGHFECSIRAEVCGGGKRRLLITSGKSHQFVVPPDDLEESGEE
jgi:hypothetical protein